MEKKFVTKGNDANRQTFATGSVRDSREGRGRFDLIPSMPLRRLAGLYERGAARYGDSNWQLGQPLKRYIDSAMRHINCLVAGEPTEDHAAAIAWNAFGYMWTLAEIEAGRLPAELDDRPAPEPEYDDQLPAIAAFKEATEKKVADEIREIRRAAVQLKKLGKSRSTK